MQPSRFTSFSDLLKARYESAFIPCARIVCLCGVFACIALAVLALNGCVDAAKKQDGLNTDSSNASRPELQADPTAKREPAGLNDLDLGQDWSDQSRRSADASAQRPAASGADSLPRRPGSVVTSDAEVAPTSVWMVVLNTFTGDNYIQAAQNMARDVRTMDPIFQNAWVHDTGRGAVVGVGKFDSVEDAAAQDTLKRVRSVQISGRQVFPRAMLSRVSVGPRGGKLKPYDLMNARIQYPKLHPLYTLDVAVWLADDAGSISYEQCRKRAEAYAQQLRAQGYEAYFHHDDDKRLSTVTVGLFDHRAVDPQSGLFSTEVESLRDHFPARLMNGEPLNVPKVDKRPDLGTEVQRPFLVLVPDE